SLTRPPAFPADRAWPPDRRLVPASRRPWLPPAWSCELAEHTNCQIQLWRSERFRGRCFSWRCRFFHQERGGALVTPYSRVFSTSASFPGLAECLNSTGRHDLRGRLRPQSSAAL